MFVHPTQQNQNQMVAMNYNQVLHQPNQGNLPVPANALMMPAQAPNIANPIFQQVLSNDPGISRYSQMISWALANEIVSKAVNTSSPLRVFGFNLYGQNNFANNEFIELAKLIAERVRISVIRNEYHSIEQAIQILVSDSYTLAAGANIRRFPDLANYVTNQVANECIAASQAMDRIYNEIAGFNNVSNQAQMAGNMGYQQNNQVQQNNTYTNFAQVNTAQQPLVNMALVEIANKPTSELSAMEKQLLQITGQPNVQPNANREQPSIQNSPLSASYRSNPIVTASGQQVNVEPVVQQPVEYVVAEPVVPARPRIFNREDIITYPEDINSLKVSVDNTSDGTKFNFVINNQQYDIESPYTYGSIDWKPSALQPYHPLVCLNHQRISYVKLFSGDILAIVQELPDGEYHMDYDKHAVNANFNNQPPLVPQTQKPVEKPSFMDVKPAGMTIARSPAVYYTSVKQAINEAYMTSYLSLQKDPSINAFVVDSNILTPFILRDKESAKQVFEELNNLLNARNFATAAEYITEIKDSHIRDTVNKVITDRVNVVIRFELSIGGLPITDFVEDHLELLKIIKENYAGAIAETIMSYQGRIIRSACDIVIGSSIDDAYQYFDDNKDEAAEVIGRTIFIAQDASITIVNFYSEDLSAFFVKESCAVLENMHPQLREIIEQALEDGPNAMNYLVTKDGHQFEIAKSMTQNTAFLIRKA